jgi:hypothetical protein
MDGVRRARWIVLVGALSVGLLLGSCKRYEVEVSLAPDGSGTRTVTFVTEAWPEDEGPSDLDAIRELFALDPERGWTKVENGSADRTRYRRTVEVSDAAGWSEQSGDVRVLGTTAPSARADVNLVNRIRVEHDAEEGTVAYSETFIWHGLLDAIIDFESGRLGSALRERYPFLTPEDMAELHGLVAGSLTVWGTLTVASEEPHPAEEAVVETVADLAASVVHRRHPEAGWAEARAIVTEALGSSEELDRYLERELPGVHLALFTGIELRVAMPGEITETNAEEVEGRTASWEIDIWDALARPVRLHATALNSAP